MIKLKSPEDIEKISASGKILSEVLGKLSEKAKIGVSLKSLNDMAILLPRNLEPSRLFWAIGLKARAALIWLRFAPR